MFRTIKIVIASAVLAAAFATASFAAPATATCPACGMPMAIHKSAMMSVPVYSKANKHVYYCCPGCKAGKAAAAYYAKHKKPMPV